MDLIDNEIDRTKNRQQDFDDLQNEASGLEVGRIRRFLTDDVNAPDGLRKKRDREAFETQLMHLLQDPIYRAKYDDTFNALRDAEQKTEATLNQLNQMILDETQSLKDMENRAARLPDNTLVFQDSNGIVRTADGQTVEDYLANTILWTGNEPDFETHQEQFQKLNDLNNTHREVEFYRDDVLGVARHRMSDEDNPPDLDELDQIMRDIEEKMPEVVKNIVPAADNNAPAVELTSNISLPSLS